MKRLLILTVVSLICTANVVAQESKLVGTWEGTLTSDIPDPNSDGTMDYQFKVFVRIKQYDEDFIVRMKFVPQDEHSKGKYFDNSTIIGSSSTSLTWNCGSAKSYDCGYVVNGQTVYSAEFSYNCSVLFDKGRLLYSYYMHTIYKNKNGNIIGTHDTPILCKTYLYQQEENW